jgi:hypothetical protein
MDLGEHGILFVVDSPLLSSAHVNLRSIEIYGGRLLGYHNTHENTFGRARHVNDLAFTENIIHENMLTLLSSNFTELALQ